MSCMYFQLKESLSKPDIVNVPTPSTCPKPPSKRKSSGKRDRATKEKKFCSSSSSLSNEVKGSNADSSSNFTLEVHCIPNTLYNYICYNSCKFIYY